MIRVGIITASDKGAVGERKDTSGEVIRELVEKQGWKVVEYAVVPDERNKIEAIMIDWCDTYKVDLLLTTGGTGFSKRDVTPEATLHIGERLVPGIAEAMRYFSLQITKRAMLSRGVSVIRKNTLLINLPGSPKGAKENLEVIIDALEHGVNILKGEASECGYEVN
ncbi:molybdenum cofactor biosynthesis protein [Anaerocolumna cellulosilytica]|uniref:Molybdenum cofactor biosynthesis protein n=1 Tax=Anaerocolumna cellulosilytica TaxID=433286 RepID=A0A6S6QV54_9FIRM|nr:MogA/MoaB family molybdenum cofactor biosynthesis protein [Anaerocolumna cellulosilytica]MBB5194294.1 molybdenum cofactor synthesis domain-containing protein [Anaerocolumna cellulosilytica]BCJ94494.1 molybdenum cofactor biosynthesis protein [Anaerocolumna cellulosilytica]